MSDTPDPSPSSSRQAPIAVVGLGSLYPGSENPQQFWRDIVLARDRMTEVPESHWLIEDYYDPDPAKPDKTYAKRGAFLSPIAFDPLEFGIPPNLLPATDTVQLLSLIVAKHVLDDVARGGTLKIDRERVSVMLGFSGATEAVAPLISRLQKPVWAKALRESGVAEAEIEGICERIARNYVPWQEASFPGLLGNVVAGRVANRLDLHGSNLTLDAACASSLAAVHAGINALLLGESDLVISGGVDANKDAFVYMCFSKTPAISLSGDCRPFSDQADGTMMGEGLGMVALKRLEDAERDGNRIYAVIRGIGSSSDGRSKSIYAPRSDGQARALRRAYARAGYGPETVELIEAHGTGTKAGDAAEVEGLRSVFGEAAPAGKPWCALGSVKSQIGHTAAAAGAAGLLKAVMALHQKVLPPTIKVERPDPELKLDASPFYLNTAARPWIRASDHPRRASVSAFGFGGTNYHLTVEEYLSANASASAASLRTAKSELFVFGADTSAALAERCNALALDASDFSARARASQQAFDANANVRLAIVAASAEDLAQRLAEANAALRASAAPALASPAGIYLSSASAIGGELALLFPGQGSQYVGMGADLAMAHARVRQVWDRAAGTRFDGSAVHDITFPPPVFDDAAKQALEARLRATEWAQPALGLASLAAFELVRALKLDPRCYLGHSFGELAALCAAGCYGVEDLLALARTRGELMRDAARANPGGMLALSASAEQAAALIARAGGDAVVANLNAADEVVVSGSVAAMQRVEELCARERVAAKRLPVAAAFHSPAVAPAVDAFAALLAQARVHSPNVDVLGNADAQAYPRDPDGIRRRLAEQLALPVRFAEQVERAYALGVRRFVEVGPGSVLADLVRRVLKDRPHVSVSIDRKARDGVTSLHHALAQLAAAGTAIDFEALWEGYEAPIERPAKRPGATVMLSGTNYGKVYPANAKERAVAPVTPQPARPAVAAPAASATAATPAPALHAPAITLPAATPAGGAAPQDATWLQAYQAIQNKMADTHAAVSRAMADSHAAFLAAMSASLADLSAGAPSGPAVFDSLPLPAMPQPTQPVARTTPAQPAATPPVADLSALLLSIVAEKTGYQAELLGMHMDLEADLGIDSIKRVEILAAMRDAVPTLPDVQAGDMAKIRTLGDVVAYLQQVDPAAHAAVPAPAASAPVASAPAPAAPPQVDLAALLLSIVAEKTGYQAELLGMHMDLEADLGIDSIKRVEILAAMRDAVPALPDVQAGDMAKIRTLGDVAAYLNQTGSSERTPRANDAPAAAAASTAALERSALRMVAESAAGLSLAGLRDAARMVVTEDGAGIAAALVRCLAERGIAAEVAAQVPADADAVIFLGGLRETFSVEEALAVNREAFHAARTLAPRATTGPCVFVTVQDTGGDFGLSGRSPTRAWLGGIAALVRTARHEWPGATLKAIDCERGSRSDEDIARAIVAELVSGGDSLDVGLGVDGARRVPRIEPSPASTSRATLAPGAVVVASGGARGVTAACLIELARSGQPHIVMLGRTELAEEPAHCKGITDAAELARALVTQAQKMGSVPPPAEINAAVRAISANREVRSTLAAIEGAGAKATYVCVDLRDDAAVRRALEDIRARCGPIKALVHGAGVLADKRIAEKTDAQFERVFDTKVRGLRTLLDATAGDELAWICLFSSFVAQAGNAGQCDYAMANAVLNHVACAERARRGSACVVRAIGWGPWEGGMVTPPLRRHFHSLGIALIPLAAGARTFVAEAAPGADTVVLAGAASTAAQVAPARERESALDIWVARKAQPYLADHAVAGVPVVPVALVIEWFLRATQGLAAQGAPVLRSLRVLRGLKLAADLPGERLRVTRRAAEAGWQLELRASGDKLAYAATADFNSVPPESPLAVEPAGTPIADAQLYDGVVLFHGRAFQALRSLESAGEDGMSADLVGLRALGWQDEAWQCDPAAIDGMIQLGAKWSEKLLGGAVLPMAFGAFHLLQAGAAAEPLRATARTRALHNARVVCDVALATRSGRLVAVLSAAEFVLRPDLQAVQLGEAAA
ncbi:MAG: SDR family NAD(P)-dependent oxidoreductase [Burkholderiales bacterium]|jgi:acyl transferase domain-containing protein